ncbi:MAG: PEP-CTERM sorting domain-containing protein [Planctomycetota bacterium]|nr:PEP-CTERM sorting domain-containing protein [Planctomycetota bacterium]
MKIQGLEAILAVGVVCLGLAGSAQAVVFASETFNNATTGFEGTVLYYYGNWGDAPVDISAGDWSVLNPGFASSSAGLTMTLPNFTRWQQWTRNLSVPLSPTAGHPVYMSITGNLSSDWDGYLFVGPGVGNFNCDASPWDSGDYRVGGTGASTGLRGGDSISILTRFSYVDGASMSADLYCAATPAGLVDGSGNILVSPLATVTVASPSLTRYSLEAYSNVNRVGSGALAGIIFADSALSAMPGSSVAWPNYLSGDFNLDGEVGPEDFGILKDGFGLDGLPFGNHESWTLGDANDDGEIGPEDFGMLKDNFGLDGGPTGTYPLTNAPEPATLALLALAGLAIRRRRA